MDLYLLFKIVGICAFGAMSPGPSWVLIINNSLFKGRSAGLITSLGHGFGIATYAMIANLSINLIIQLNILIFQFIKFLSIIFLIYLGYKSFQADKINISKNIHSKKFRSFFEGYFFAILNPKVFIWFIAIYSQFITVSNSLIFNIFLILTAGIVDIIWYCVLTIIVTTGSNLNLIKNKSLIIQKLIGIIFISIGFLLLFELIPR